MKRQNWWLIVVTAVILAFGLWTRIFRLQELPLIRQYDELVYVLQAQAAILTGTGLDGVWTPLSLQPVMPMYSELTTTVLMPWLALGLPVKIASFLPFMLISLGSPILIALLVYEISKNKRTAYFAWIIALFNPWIWQAGRLGFDSVWSFFFYLLGSWLFLKLRGWKKLWSLLPFVVGFYQYQGHKALLPFLMLSLCLYQFWPIWQEKARDKGKAWRKMLPELLISGFLVVLTAVYVLVWLPKQSNLERTSTMLSLESELVTERVNLLRRLSLTSPLKNVFNNKYVVTMSEILRRMVNTYNPQQLFVKSGEDEKMFYVVSNYGILHLLDLVLIIGGIVALAAKPRRRAGVFLLALLVAASAPTWIADGEWYFYRASFRVVPLIMIAAWGAEAYWRRGKIIGRTALVMLYGLSVVYFANFYFTYLPLKAAADPFFGDRILLEYLQRETSGREIQIMTNDQRVTWMNAIYESGGLTPETIEQAKVMWQEKKFAWGKATFGPGCFDPAAVKESENLVVISYDYRGCDDNAKSVKDELDAAGISYLAIRSPIDNGEKYFLVNDQVCQEKELAGPLLFQNWSELNLSALSTDDLCRLWLSPKF